MTKPHAHAAARALAVSAAHHAVRRHRNRRRVAVVGTRVADPCRGRPGLAGVGCADDVDPARFILGMVANLPPPQRNHPFLRGEYGHSRHDRAVWVVERDDPAAKAKARRNTKKKNV